MFKKAVAAAGSLCVAWSAAVAQTTPADHGAKIYQRCAACHLPNGQGVPGAFPTLAGRVSQAAARDDGRDYLVMTVVAGVMGAIDVDGKTIRGIMPAQAGLADADIAAVLNHVIVMPDASAVKARPFTAEEVAAIKARHQQSTPSSVHTLRSAAFPAAQTDAK
jgi:mono/diheme cytochrome c family protein